VLLTLAKALSANIALFRPYYIHRRHCTLLRAFVFLLSLRLLIREQSLVLYSVYVLIYYVVS
jgi:hypothetical protein